MRFVRLLLASALTLVGAGSAAAQQAEAVPVGQDSVRIFLRDVDLGAALEAVGQYLDRPVMMGSVGPAPIGLFETPRPIPTGEVLTVLRGVVEMLGLRIEETPDMIRILPPEPVDPRTAQPAAPPSQALELHTIRLRHAQAEDVAAVLNQLFGTGQRLAPASQPPAGARAAVVHDQEEPATGRLAGDVVVVPDVPTNSILVRASEADYALLSDAVQELDIRPLQVLIEVIIVEARKDRRFEFGFSAELDDARVGDATVDADLDGTTLGDLVVRVMGLGYDRLNVVLTAARSRGDAEILSRPVLVAANNTEANLLVGTEQPFIEVSRSLPTDTPQRDQVVQYRDVGTELTVIPTINQDGYVMLEIRQDVSQVTGETQFDAPVISSRHASTRLLVRDEQTIVIGGLTDQVVDNIRTGIPLLADIPIVGGLFGATRNRTTETELFLFITPKILYDDITADLETRRRLPIEFRELWPEGELLLPDSVGPQIPTASPPDSTRGGGAGR